MPNSTVSPSGPYFYPSGQAKSGQQRWWLHLLLLLLTLLTATLAGAEMAQNFHQNQPELVIHGDFRFLVAAWHSPALLLQGLPFSLTLLLVLGAHELGHYVACWYHRVDASLPYFLPSPLLIGTFGAFIKVRSPIYSLRSLFDIGVAGPIAGFLMLLPFLGWGLAHSKLLPGIATQGDITFGTPLLVRLAELAIWPGVNPQDLALHPVARGAWVGLFATALNLLPIGQLDGGHLLYSLNAARHRQVSRLCALVLIPMGYFWLGWLCWGLFFLLAPLRRPPIADHEPLDGSRKQLAVVAVLLLILCFMPIPLRTGVGL